MSRETSSIATANANNLELHKGDQFIIALDISSSMQATDCPSGLSRTKYTLEQFEIFVKEASKYDPDGVSLLAFGATVHAWPNVSGDKLDAVIQAVETKGYEGATMTHSVVQKAYAEHVSSKNEQTVLMVFTDGQPTDEEALLKVIADITNQVKDPREFCITFITVGMRSAGLENFLAKLDDGIPGAKYDIVDVKHLEDVDFYKAFDGAIND